MGRSFPADVTVHARVEVRRAPSLRLLWSGAGASHSGAIHHSTLYRIAARLEEELPSGWYVRVVPLEDRIDLENNCGDFERGMAIFEQVAAEVNAWMKKREEAGAAK